MRDMCDRLTEQSTWDVFFLPGMEQFPETKRRNREMKRVIGARGRNKAPQERRARRTRFHAQIFPPGTEKLSIEYTEAMNEQIIAARD